MPAFTQAQLLRDFDALCDILRREYPFLPVLARRGIDAEALFAETRTVLAREGVDLRRFYDAVALMFGRMENLAHLTWIDPASYADYAGYAAEGLLSDARAALVSDARTRAVYESLGADGVGLWSAAGRALREVDVDYYPEQAALVMRFSSFDHALIERDLGIVAAALERWPDARHVVFDVTGNRGGSDYYWSAVIVAPFGGEYARPIVAWLRPTPAHERDRELHTANEYAGTPPDFVRELGLTHYFADEEVMPLAPYGGPPVGAGVRRWVLIDGGTYSAADGFAAFCKATGWATLVGAPALGDGAAPGAPALYRLPETGLLLHFRDVAVANADGTLNAETGTRPDFACKPRETPLRACLRLIGAR